MPRTARRSRPSATQPIEISSPFGSGTCIVIRGGGSVGKASPKTSLTTPELADVGHEDGGVHHQFRAAAAGAQHGLDVAHRLARLRGERIARQLAGLGIDAALAGDVEGTPARTPGEYGPIVGGTPGPVMTCFSAHRVSSSLGGGAPTLPQTWPFGRGVAAGRCG